MKKVLIKQPTNTVSIDEFEESKIYAVNHDGLIYKLVALNTLDYSKKAGYLKHFMIQRVGVRVIMLQHREQ